DRRIEEAFHRGEGDEQPFRYPAEGQADLKRRIGDGQIPELMLKDDRHLLRITLAQARGYSYPRGPGGEGDVEMMVAGKTGASRLDQNLAHDAAQRLLDEHVVADEVFGHRQ